MILFYRIITTFLYPIIVLIIFFRKLIGKEDKIRFKEKIFIKDFSVNRNEEEKLIWFHAASIGEFKSIIPIIEELNKSRKKIRFLITTVTLSSANLAKYELKKFNNVIHSNFHYECVYMLLYIVLR